jgi:hypothetical protein
VPQFPRQLDGAHGANPHTPVANEGLIGIQPVGAFKLDGDNRTESLIILKNQDAGNDGGNDWYAPDQRQDRPPLYDRAGKITRRFSIRVQDLRLSK